MDRRLRMTPDEQRELDRWKRLRPALRWAAVVSRSIFWVSFIMAAVATPILVAVALWQEGDASAQPPRLDFVVVCWLVIGALWIVSKCLTTIRRFVDLVCRLVEDEHAATTDGMTSDR